MALGTRTHSRQTADGFTTIELLVTIAVIAVVLTISAAVITNPLAGAQEASATLSSQAVAAFDTKWTTSGFTVVNGSGHHAGMVIAFDDVNVNGRYDTGESLVGRVRGRLAKTGTATGTDTPDQPTQLTWVQTSATSSTLTWTAPASSSPLTGYTIQTSPAGQLTVFHAGTAHSATISGLHAEQGYSATVIAFNANGAGDLSEQVWLSTSVPPGTSPGENGGTDASSGGIVTGTPAVPTAPRDVAAHVTGPLGEVGADVTVTWAPPESNGGSPIAFYRVQHATDSAFSDAQTVTTADTSVVLTARTSGTTVYARVTAVTAAGPSEASTAASVVISNAPDAPPAPTVTSLSPSMLLATWHVPASHGFPITGYTVRYATDTAMTTGVQTQTVPAATTAATLARLTHGVRYLIQVSATSTAGTGAWSAPTSAVPVSAPETPAGLTLTATSPTSMTATWTAPNANGSPVTGYELAYSTSATVHTAVVTRTTTGTTLDIAGLAPDTRYYATVTARNAIAASPASTIVSIRTPALPAPPLPEQPALPPAPACAAMVINNAASFTLTWAAPASTSGSPIVSYRIQVATNSAFTSGVSVVDTGSSAVSRKFIPVTPGTTYFARVATTTAFGTGAYSTCTATGTTWSSPAQVAGVIATWTSATTATLAWDALPPVQGTDIISYRITRATNPGMNGNVTTIDTGSTTRTATMTGLTAGVTYYYTVAATSHAKTGTASEVVSLRQ